MIAKMAEYHSTEGFFGKAFLLKSASVIDATLVERSVLQFKIIKSCSFYTKYALPFQQLWKEVSLLVAFYILANKRHRLTQKRPGKLTWVHS